jgi:hypothetical protein
MTTLVLIAAIVCGIGLAIFGIIAESRIGKLKRELDTTEYYLNAKTEVARKQLLEIMELHKENRDLSAKLRNSYYRDKKGRIRKYQGE